MLSEANSTIVNVHIFHLSKNFLESYHLFDNKLIKNFTFTIVIIIFFFTNYEFIILSLMCLIIYKNKIMLFLFKNVKILKV